MSISNKHLFVALALSLAGHLVFVAFAPIEPPEIDDKATVLTTRITAMPPPPMPKAAAPAPVAAAKPKPKPKPKTVAPVGAVVAALPSTEPPAVPIEEPPPEPVVEKKPEPEAPKIVEDKVATAEPVATPPPEMPAPMSTASASGYTPQELAAMKEKSKGEKQLEALPRLIDLNYKAAYAQGDAYPLPVGNFKLRFEHTDGKYELRTVGQASGFFRFVYPGVLSMKSVGKLNERGLEPDKFEMRREREGQNPRIRTVVFDREANLIRLTDKPPVPIEGQVFDALTFIVQFYFAVPDTDEVTLQVVSPTRVDAYTLKRGGKEMLDTPQGKIEMEIWRGSRKSAPGEAEFWLAPSWHYIPFKVRMTDEKERKASFELESVAVEAKPAS